MKLWKIELIHKNTFDEEDDWIPIMGFPHAKKWISGAISRKGKVVLRVEHHPTRKYKWGHVHEYQKGFMVKYRRTHFPIQQAINEMKEDLLRECYGGK